MNKPSKKSPILGITIGDLNGVGPEIVIDSFKEGNLMQFFTPVIYASAQTLIYHKKLIGAKNFNFQLIKSPSEVEFGKVNVINAWEGEVKIEVGTPDPSTGSAALQSIEMATQHLKEGLIDGLVTAPINKKTVQSERFQFPGHTEYLAQTFESENHLMLLVGENLKVATVTGHIPLSAVAENITKKSVLKALKALNKSLVEDFAIDGPKIAVLGLNPHAGDNGLIGLEDKESISSALEEAGRQGIKAFGPYPADGFFGICMHRDFDAVLSMYHDQGLVPFKLLEFERGVNYTAGLPVVRTSPDHGTGYNIAGKGQASNKSFIEALYLAVRILKNRAAHAESVEAPLQSRIHKLKEENR